MKTTSREPAIALGLLLLWGLVLGFPLLSKGFPVLGHDFWAHTTWGGHFAQQFWSGEIYPRWLINHNEGLGSPTFFFYPPLPFWLTAWLSPFFPDESAPVSALAWVATAMLVLSGWFTYLWLRESVPARAAVLAAAIYQVAPYHLVINLYQRAAFAEFCAMTWFPLILFAAHRVSQRRERYFLLLALATAFLSLTHLLSLLIFGPIVPAYAALLAAPGRKLRASAATALAMGLGLGLSGAYLIPAVTLQPNVSMHVLWQGWGHYQQYLYDWKLVLAADQHVFLLLLLLSLVSNIVVATLLYLLACLAGTSTSAAQPIEARAQPIHFWMLLVLAVGFMLTKPSDFLWQILTPLQRIQFPWRQVSLLTVAVTALFAQAAAGLRPGMSLSQRLAVWAIVIITSCWLMVTALDGLQILSQTPQPELNRLAQDAWEYKPRWVQSDDFGRAVKHARDPDGHTPKARLSTEGQISVVHWRPRDIKLLIESPRDSVLTVYQFFFPGWKALMDGQTPIQVQPSQPHGLVTLAMPAGSHSVELRMTPNERNGWLLTGLSAAIWVAHLLLVRRRSTRANVSGRVASSPQFTPAPAEGPMATTSSSGREDRRVRGHEQERRR